MAATKTEDKHGHGRLWWAVSTILVAIALLLTIVGWSWSRADAAVDKASEATMKVGKLEGEVTTSFRFIERELTGIRVEQSAQRKILMELAKEKHSGGGE